MQRISRLIAVLGCALALGSGVVMPSRAWADEPAGFEVASEPTVVTDVAGSQDSDALLRGYLEERIDAALPVVEPTMGEQSVHESLTGDTAIAYEYVLDAVKEIAAGERSSTEVSIPLAVFTGKTQFTAADLGLEYMHDGADWNPGIGDAVYGLVNIDFKALVDALLFDHPYEMYWFNKVEGYSYQNIGGYGIDYDWGKGDYVVTVDGDPTITFEVVQAYAAGAYEVVTPVGANVTAAIENAEQIVKTNSGKTTYEKLVAYKEAICNMVDYNHEAADDDSTPFGDPWQLINVFDGDDSTKVVCEGYSKAFKYLCDLAGFGNVECLLATGTMSGGTGAGPHMWNILKMPDGKSYLVDVTNCDTGSIGAPDLLFLKGYKSGSVAEGYVYSSRGVTYHYDAEMSSLYSEAELTMSAADYDPASAVEPTTFDLSDADVILHETSFTYSGSECTPSPEVFLNGNLLAQGTDYSLAYENNVNAGEATVTITGLGGYTGTTTATFTILRGEQTIEASDMTLVYGSKTPLGARTSGDGVLSYQSSDGSVATVNSRGEVLVHGVGTTAVTIKAAQTSNCNAAEKTVTVTVNPYDIANGRADVTPRTFTYSGTACEPRPTVVVTLGTGMRTISTESLDVTYANNVDAGRAVATLTGKGNFTGTATASFTIDKADQTINARDIVLPFRSDAMAVGATVTGVGDEAGALSYAIQDESIARVSADGKIEPVAHGETTLTITAAATKNLNEARTRVVVRVTPKALEGLTVDVVEPRPDYLVYDGTPKEPDIRVTYGDETVPEEDYDVVYGNNIDAGEATVTVTLTGDYEGVGYGSFTIAQAAQVIAIANEEALALTYGDMATLDVTAEGNLTFASSDTNVFTVSDKGEIEAIGAGNAVLTISTPGTKNYASAMLEAPVHVLPADISSATVVLEANEFIYDGNPKNPQVTVTVGDIALTTDDYTVTYADNIDAGQVTVTVTGTRNYAGTVTSAFAISKASQTISAQDIVLPFGSEPVAVGATVTGVCNEAGELSYAIQDESIARVSAGGKVEPVALGDTTLTITAAATKNLSEATTEVRVSVVPAVLEDLAIGIVESRPDYLVYDGTPKEPEVMVTINDQPLSPDDYIVKFENNINVGEATVCVTLTGNYEGYGEGHFAITQAPQAIQIANDEVLAMTYGDKATLDVRAVGDLTFASSDTNVFTVSDKGEIEAVGTGQAELTVTASGNENYAKAELRAVVRVVGVDITAAEVTVEPDTFTYDGTAKEPQVSVTVGDALVPLESLEVRYAANTNAGEARVEVTAKSGSNYTGDAMKTFTIVKAQQTIGISCPDALTLNMEHTAEIGAVAESQETGSATGLALTYVSSDEAVATVGESGLITALSKGSATITVSAAGDENHEPASRTIELTVADTDISHAVVAVSVKSLAYNGRAQEPAVTVELDGVTLVQGVDYKVVFSNNTNAGQAALTVEGIGQYAGTQFVEQAFTIAKANPVISASTTECAIGKKTKLGALASAGAGKLTYKSSKTSVATVNSKGQVKGLKAGKVKITVTCAESANYLAGSKTFIVKVGKANPLAVKAKAGKVTVAAKTAAKKAVTLANNVKFTKKGQGKVTYANASANATAKKFKVAAKTGKITVPKGTPKGTYKVKLQVKSKGTSKYISGTKTVTFKVVVK